MDIPSNASHKTGYTRLEFRLIFQVYSQNVYKGFFRNFCFTEYKGGYLISFQEACGKTPLVSIEKRRLGPDRSLFIATTPSLAGPREIVRSEKIDIFTERLKDAIARLRETDALTRAGLKIVS